MSPMVIALLLMFVLQGLPKNGRVWWNNFEPLLL